MEPVPAAAERVRAYLDERDAYGEGLDHEIINGFNDRMLLGPDLRALLAALDLVALNEPATEPAPADDSDTEFRQVTVTFSDVSLRDVGPIMTDTARRNATKGLDREVAALGDGWEPLGPRVTLWLCQVSTTLRRTR